MIPILSILALAVVALIELFVIVDFMDQRQKLREHIQWQEESIESRKRLYRAALDKIKQMETPASTPITAAEVITVVHPRRLKLRRSASEQVHDEAESHRTKERKHLDITANIEAIGVHNLQPKK